MCEHINADIQRCVHMYIRVSCLGWNKRTEICVRSSGEGNIFYNDAIPTLIKEKISQ